MQLLTQTILKRLPPLYTNEELGLAAKAQVKFFTPDANWTWYGTEYDPEAQLFFGYVIGLEDEFGYFSLPELKAVRGALGLPVERDRYFKPTSLQTLQRHYREKGYAV